MALGGAVYGGREQSDCGNHKYAQDPHPRIASIHVYITLLSPFTIRPTV
jgi:hypothetical protein